MSAPLRGLASGHLLGWRPRALGVSLLAATASFGALLLGTSAWLIAKAALRPSIAALHVAIAGVRFFGLARALSRYLERLVTHDVTLRASGRLRAALAARLAPLAPGRLAAGSGDAMARVVADVEELEAAYLRLFAPAVAGLLVTAGIAAFLATRGTGLALAWTASVLVAGALAPALVTRATRAGERRRVATRGVLHARLADGIRGLPDLVAFGRARAHADEVAGLAASLATEERRGGRLAAAGGALAGLAADLGVVALLALAIPAVRSGALDGLQLAVVALVALAGFEVVAPLATAFRARGGLEAAASRVQELLDARPAVLDPAQPEAVGAGARVELRRLRFSHGHQPVLDGLDLVLERGRLVALVGPSGAGKSTVVQLLSRVWDVEPGQLFFDGVDVRRLAAPEVRRLVASASVRDHVFAGTLRENLRLAAPEAGDERLWDALVRAELGPFARGLAAGLDTWVGEHGVALSGGERQRLVLARALLREAPIRLLDEPTAHLDAATAARVMRRLFADKERCATLVVSHRLTGLEAADEIVVLVRGRVAERGTWDALMAMGGVFARAVAEERGEGAWVAATRL